MGPKPSALAVQSPDALAGLVAAIQGGIANRGFYFLIDERLKLICGPSYNGYDLRPCLANIVEFANKHGWQAEIAGTAVRFTSLN